MPRVDTRKLRSRYDAYVREDRENDFFEHIDTMIESGDRTPSDFSIRDLFEDFVDNGRQIIREWQRGSEVNLMESGIATGAFRSITEKVVRGEMLEGFSDPTFIGESLVTTRPTTAIDGERIPGFTRLGDVAEAVGINQPYPEVGFGDDWIDVDPTEKYGHIVSVGREHVMADQTGRILDQAREVGLWLGYRKEIRILDCVLGLSGSIYKRRGRTACAVYGDSSGTHDWDNLQASNALVDWTDIQAAELLLDAITDPNTGTPVLVMANALIVPSALKHTANRILNATEINHADVDNQANASTIRLGSVAPNPMAGSGYTAYTSPLVASRTSSSSTWFFGNFQRAFQYRENWGLTTTQQGVGSDAEFNQDIIARFKASERGVAVAVEPRYVVKSTA